MEQHKNIILNLTQDEYERINAERWGLVLIERDFKISKPAAPPRDQKIKYRASATPSVIRLLQERYEVEIEN